MIGIYKITNTLNGKVYIGQSKNIEKRWKEHIRKSYKGCVALRRAFDKYGIQNFSFEILKSFSFYSPCVLNFYERLHISKHASVERGYNLKSGGAKSVYSEESRQRMSDAKKGISTGPFSETHKKAISDSKKGSRCPDQSKPVRCVETEVEYSSATRAAAANNVSTSAIVHAIQKGKTSQGVHWEYTDTK